MLPAELLAIISFVERLRAEPNECLGLSSPEPFWNMVLYFMRRHLEGKPVTVSSLADAAKVSHGTAMRRIAELDRAGLIARRPRTPTGKSASLHPSEELLRRFNEYALHVKRTVGRTFGNLGARDDPAAYYFGASYMAAQIITAPEDTRISGTGPIRLLVNDNPNFRVLEAMRPDLERWLGARIEMTLADIDRLHGEIVANGKRRTSRFDIVAVENTLVGAYAEARILQPLDELIAASLLNPTDFLPTGWEAVNYRDLQYGVPFQPMPELLFYRKDLFERAGLAPPETVEEVVAAARALHRPKQGFSGIVWAAGRGSPIGRSYIEILGSFGRPPLNLRPVGADFDIRDISGAARQPTIDTEPGRRAAAYLRSLVDYSPPNILDMDWEQAGRTFIAGKAAMMYAFTSQAAKIEYTARSPARGRVGFLALPRGAGGRNVAPVGGYALGIPANVSPRRLDRIFRILEWLTSPQITKLLVLRGATVSPRFSVSNDPEVRGARPIISIVDRLARNGQLQIWQRPPVPEFARIVNVLGNEVHDALAGRREIGDALARAQSDCEKIMRAALRR